MQAPRNQLTAGYTLTIIADAVSNGSVRRLAASGSSTTYAAADIAASTTTVIGPFPTARQYEILSSEGELTYSITESDTSPRTSENLADEISDETGTGAAVFGTAPTLAAPAITYPVATASANGAITITSGVVNITKAGVCALTLAAPTTDGITIVATSSTANAHTITATGIIRNGVVGGHKSLITFAAYGGASVTLVSIDGHWNVVSQNNVTIS
jgi:hypothetical protein